MPVTPTVLFDMPQHELVTLLESKLAGSISTRIVCGFATVEGVRLLHRVLSTRPNVVDAIVVGAGTYQAYEAFDNLIAAGVRLDRLFVHLGHTRQTSATAKHRFYRYHPMLHSKIYYAEHEGGTAIAFIGSHNMTGFALAGLNGEAAVLLEGEVDSPQFAKVREHIDNAIRQSVQYTPGMKEAFSWWTHQFMEGLSQKANDLPKDGVSRSTVVILAESEKSGAPDTDDVIYFELPRAIGTITSLKSEVHLYLFDRLPSTPWVGLQSLHLAARSYWCTPLGLELERGGVELQTNWHIDDHRHPVLKRASSPFRPHPASSKQQVRVKARYDVRDRFEYLFQPPSKGWMPVLDRSRPLDVHDAYVGVFEVESRKPNPEHLEWYPVIGLEPSHRADSAFESEVRKMSPDEGSFVMLSLRRRTLVTTPFAE